MRAVEAGQHVEGGGDRVGGQLHVVVDDELGELEDLAGHEHRPQGGGGEEPGAGLGLVVAGHGVVGEDHGQRAHQQHERADRGEGDVVDLGGGRPLGEVLGRIEEIVGDESTEEQELGAEEGPHRQLAVLDTGRLVLGMMLIHEPDAITVGAGLIVGGGGQEWAPADGECGSSRGSAPHPISATSEMITPRTIRALPTAEVWKMMP